MQQKVMLGLAWYCSCVMSDQYVLPFTTPRFYIGSILCRYSEEIGRFRKTFCKIIGRCGENVGKILYKNGLQVSVGHLRVPGAGVEPARL